MSAGPKLGRTDERSILSFIREHPHAYDVPSLVELGGTNKVRRAQIAAALHCLLYKSCVTRDIRSLLALTALGMRVLNPTPVKAPLSSRSVLQTEEHEAEGGGGPGTMEGRIIVTPDKSIPSLIQPMRNARRLFIEAAVVKAEKLDGEYLVQIRTNATEFKKDERRVVIDLNHAELLRKWLDTVLPKLSKRKGA